MKRITHRHMSPGRRTGQLPGNTCRLISGASASPTEMENMKTKRRSLPSLPFPLSFLRGGTKEEGGRGGEGGKQRVREERRRRKKGGNGGKLTNAGAERREEERGSKKKKRE